MCKTTLALISSIKDADEPQLVEFFRNLKRPHH